VDYALKRFPAEPRFLLARAFSLDQSRAFDDQGAAQGSHAREVLARYDEAARFDDTAAEAHVRKAFFLHRIGRHREALAALDAGDADASNRDAVVGYLHRLIRGRVLEALERFDEARTAYEAARQTQPRAQSPRVALMRLLVRAGDRPGAAALASAIQTAPAGDFDPWWLYWVGDYRQYGSIVGRLREFTR
jgi:tetratricopeptide (TPR) repeat protein